MKFRINTVETRVPPRLFLLTRGLVWSIFYAHFPSGLYVPSLQNTCQFFFDTVQYTSVSSKYKTTQETREKDEEEQELVSVFREV